MITIFHGTDQLTIAERVAEMRREIDPSDFSTTVVDDAAADVEAVRAASGAVGFFGTGRIVIARDLLAVKTRRGRKRKADSDTDAIVSMLSGVPDSTSLLVVEHQLDVKLERAVRRAVPEVRVERCDVPRGQRLVEWVCARARRYHAVIGQGEARALLEALFPGSWPAESRRDDVPPDMFRLDNEIAKLATAAGSEGTVSAEHVTSLVPGAEAQDFWGITNAILSGDSGKAIVEIERAYSLGSAAEAILGQVTSQLEVLAVSALANRTTTVAELSSVSGLSEGRLRQSGRYSTSFPARRIGAALDALRSLDEAAKQGHLDLADSLVPTIAAMANGTVEELESTVRQ